MAARERRRHGSVYRRKRADGTHYAGFYIRYTDAWGNRRQEWGGPNKTAAEATLRKRGAQRDENRRTGARQIERIGFDQLTDRVLEHWEATLRPTTVAGRRGFLNKVKAHFGKTPLVEIATSDVQQLLDGCRRADGLKPATIRHHASVLSSAFSFAIQLGAAERNPVKGVKLPRVQRTERPYLTDDQRRTIYRHMPTEIRTCVMLMGDAGLRRSEAVELTWDAVGQAFDYVTVKQAKNHKTRMVHLTKRAAAALRAEHKRSAARMRGRTRVFSFTTTTLNKLFRDGADEAGFPKLTPHVLRHAFASGLVRSGTDLPTVARLLGHADIQMAAHYGQWAPENASELAIRAFEKTHQKRSSRSSRAT